MSIHLAGAYLCSLTASEAIDAQRTMSYKIKQVYIQVVMADVG